MKIERTLLKRSLSKILFDLIENLTKNPLHSGSGQLTHLDPINQFLEGYRIDIQLTDSQLKDALDEDF